jgi:hypothetical protein
LSFNHVAAMLKDKYVRAMAGVLENDSTAYEALVRNLLNQNTYLISRRSTDTWR